MYVCDFVFVERCTDVSVLQASLCADRRLAPLPPLQSGRRIAGSRQVGVSRWLQAGRCKQTEQASRCRQASASRQKLAAKMAHLLRFLIVFVRIAFSLSLFMCRFGHSVCFFVSLFVVCFFRWLFFSFPFSGLSCLSFLRFVDHFARSCSSIVVRFCA